MNIGQVLEAHLGWAAKELGFQGITPVFDGANEMEIEAELARAWMMDLAWKETGEKSWEWLKQQEYDPESIKDDEEVRLLYMEQIWVTNMCLRMQPISICPTCQPGILVSDRGFNPLKSLLGNVEAGEPLFMIAMPARSY